MLKNLYCIYDKVAQESGPIFEAKNDGVAERMYFDLVQNQRKNPVFDQDDYELLCLGSFDSESLKIVPLPNSKRIVLNQEVEDGSE